MPHRCRPLSQILDPTDELHPFSDFRDPHLLQARHVQIEKHLAIDIVPLEQPRMVTALVNSQPGGDLIVPPSFEVVAEGHSRWRMQ
jgi:hypothetical protein